MNNIKYRLLTITLLLLLLSCSENRKGEKDKQVSQNKRDVILSFEFPDTVKLNTRIKGKLKYNKNFFVSDTSKVSERHTYLHLTVNQKPDTVLLKQFDKISNRLAFQESLKGGDFKFFSVFKEPGKHYLHGAIEDIFVLEDNNTETEIKEVTFMKEVFVVKNK